MMMVQHTNRFDLTQKLNDDFHELLAFNHEEKLESLATPMPSQMVYDEDNDNMELIEEVEEDIESYSG